MLLKRVIAICLAAILPLCFFCACAAEGEACDTPLTAFPSDYAFSPETEQLNFNRKREQDGLTFYFEQTLSKKMLERAIGNVTKANSHCKAPDTVYVLKDGVTFLDENALFVNADDPPELILSVLLEDSATADLPFGLFAGVGTALLQEEREIPLCEGEKLTDLLVKYPYVMDLQYPLFLPSYTKREERTAAWSYSLRLGNAWLSQKSIDDLKSAKIEDLAPLLSQIGAGSPAFYCPIGDPIYPLQAVTENFHYYFDPAFQDPLLSKSEFAPDYLAVKAYVEENEGLYAKNEALFKPYVPDRSEEDHPKEQKKTDIFVGNYGISTSYYLDFQRRSLCLQNVTITMFALTELLLYDTIGLNELHYGFCDYLNMASSYNKIALFHLYQGKSAKTGYPKETLASAKKLYEGAYKKADLESFDAYAYLDCLAHVLNGEQEGKMHYMGQLSSFLGYLYQTYGMDLLIKLDKNTEAGAGGKSTSELIAEWQEHLTRTYGR